MRGIRLRKWLVGTCVASVTTLLAGCASPYGPAGERGGYIDRQVSENVWRVGYFGNSSTSRDQVLKYWLNRCAELTVQNGFGYFSLMREKASSVPGYDVNPQEHARMSGRFGPHVPTRTILYFPVSVPTTTLPSADTPRAEEDGARVPGSNV